MIHIRLLPVLPHVAEASLEYLAFGLQKLSALGLFMLHPHRHGDVCRPFLPSKSLSAFRQCRNLNCFFVGGHPIVFSKDLVENVFPWLFFLMRT